MIEHKRQAVPWVRDAWCSVRLACDCLPGKDMVNTGMIRGTPFSSSFPPSRPNRRSQPAEPSRDPTGSWERVLFKRMLFSSSPRSID
jgi:hypothetical protein